MKHALAMFRRNAGALVCDREKSLITESFHADHDR
jgi:hypothetical protein